MDYNRVALFVRVVRAGGFTAAAAEAKLPKSSLSRAVSLLESELGVRLLQRTTRKVSLTEVGQAYFEAVKGSVAGIEDADAIAGEHGNAPRGFVRMAAPPDYEYLPAAIARFQRKYPAVRVEVSVGSRFVDLVGEGFDLALRAGKLEDSTLVARRIGGTEFLILAAPSYLRRRGRPKRIEELEGHDWVSSRSTGGRSTLALTNGTESHAIEVAPVMAGDDLSFCRKAVEAGAGLGLLPIHSVKDAVNSRALELVLPDWGSRGASLHVVLPTARFVPARVALLRDFLVEDLGGHLTETDEQCKKKRAT